MVPDMDHVTRLDRLVMRHTVECWRPLRHRAYNRFDTRLKSFDSWPKHGEAPSPTSLSEAGFFYDGTYRHNFEYLFLFQFHIFFLLIRNFSLQVDLMKQHVSIAVLDYVIGASPKTRGTNMCVGRRFVFMSM